jgi:cytochrome c oxidase subunit 2
MIRTLRIFGIAVLAASQLFAASGPVAARTSIDVVASNWKFTPSTISLHVGEATTIRLTSSEGVHGLASEDLGIPATTISPGQFTSVTVTPKKAGKYVIHCSIMCGAGHPNMALTVNVLP